MADTRKDKRAPVSLKVRFKSATVDEFIEQYAKDISRGGLFIKSKSPMPVGTLLKFEVQLKDESPLINGVGRVVWKREAGDTAGDDSPSGMGIKFIRMDAECRAVVEKMVTQRGDTPGQFEAGGGDPEELGATAAAKPRKATVPFFPAGGPLEADMPAPEDRTQVRHASEFLASALAEAGGDSESAREAERRAEEARKRSEEIERERAAVRAREAEAESARIEREKTEAAEAAKAEEAKRDADVKAAAAAVAATVIAESEPPAAASKREERASKTSEPPAKAKEPAKAKPADEPAKAKPRPVVAREVDTARTPPVEEPKSYVIPAVIGIAALLGLGYVALNWNSGASVETPETAAAPVEPETTDEAAVDQAAIDEAALAEEGATDHGATGDEALPVEGATPTTAEDTAAQQAALVVAEEPAAPVARFRVETTPPGATITVDGASRGTSPAEIEAPIGTAIAVAARLAGHREATQQVTPTATQRPVRLTLQPLPYVIEVTTNVPGTRVRAGARTATTAADAPSRLTITRPGASITVAGTRAGYADASQAVAPTAFTERNGEMVATVSLTLTERPIAPIAATPRPPRTQPPEEGAAAGGGADAPPAGGSDAPPAGAATPEPAPEPAPEPEEAPPDNPF